MHTVSKCSVLSPVAVRHENLEQWPSPMLESTTWYVCADNRCMASAAHHGWKHVHKYSRCNATQHHQVFIPSYTGHTPSGNVSPNICRAAAKSSCSGATNFMSASVRGCFRASARACSACTTQHSRPQQSESAIQTKRKAPEQARQASSAAATVGHSPCMRHVLKCRSSTKAGTTSPTCLPIHGPVTPYSSSPTSG